MSGSLSSKILVSRHVDFVEDQFPFAQLTCFQPRVHENVVQDWVPHYVLPLSHSIPPILARSSTPSLSTVVPTGINNSSDTTEHLSMAANWPLRQLNVNNAFLHGQLIEDVFMAQPKGFVDVSRPNYVYHCLFICSTAGVTLYLDVYVDDLIVTGVKVVKTDHGLFLSQRKYIEDIVDRTLMTGAKPVPTPLAVNNSLSLNDSALLDNPFEYRTIVGSL
ncbi:hypothetical protein GH714_035426 [Hevea brasiliensis]|uniref:Reverse transcriptase Ty1/copia-type domain-containing protein n=1 Tax=Hevea brasiliensis TaxID=3981 RepID=A0A6A6N8N5_HEVBR|nr:hypothetical protein GH714_035426 [Hevea brasiliensis]